MFKFVLFMLFSVNVMASPYSQPAISGSGFPSYNDGSASSRWVYDDFHLNKDTTIIGLTWVGTYTNTYASVGVSNFEIAFYSSIDYKSGVAAQPNFTPSGLLYSYTTLDRANETPSKFANQYDYSVVFPTAIELKGNRNYWLSITAIQPFWNGDWNIAQSNIGDKKHIVGFENSGGGMRYLAAVGDTAFNIVPIPSSIWLLFSGLVALIRFKK